MSAQGVIVTDGQEALVQAGHAFGIHSSVKVYLAIVTKS